MGALKDFCEKCVDDLSHALDFKRAELWQNLPIIFDLPYTDEQDET